MKELDDILDWISDNRYLVLMWLASTLFFIYQQTTGASWDFVVYEMNAEYLCCDGHYFEWTRPPFAPFLMIISATITLFTWNYAAYVYAAIVSAIFAAGAVKMADSFGLDRRLFYALMLSPYALTMGMMAGTELLTLGLLMLFLSYLKSIKGAFFLGLAGLTRYPALIFTPFILLQKNWKKILASLAVLVLVASPWLLYSEVRRDDPIYSAVNSYALTVQQREGMEVPPDVMHFLVPVGYYLPLLFAGIYIKWKDEWKERDWVVAAFALLAIISYLQSPHKEPRYLFNLILPAGYFSYHLLEGRHEKLFLAVIGVNFALAAIFFVPLARYASMDDAIQATDDCMARSNLWVPMNYHGKEAEAIVRDVPHYVEEGKRVVVFKYVQDYGNYVTEEVLEEQPVIEETETYIVFGDEERCSPERKVDRSFIEREGDIRGIEGCKDVFPNFLCIFSS